MKIVWKPKFKKHFKKRIAPSRKIRVKFHEKVELFLEDCYHPSLRTHQLKGSKRGYWSFSVTGDIRVVYKIAGKTLFLYDIGTHPQVY